MEAVWSGQIIPYPQPWTGTTTRSTWTGAATCASDCAYWPGPYESFSDEPPQSFRAVRTWVKCWYCGRKNKDDQEMCEGCVAPLE